MKHTAGNCTVPRADGQPVKTGVLILGGGFGGVYAALEFEKLLRRRRDIEVTLVSRDNFFLFTPMLHEIAASDLEVNAIVNPLRKMLRRVGSFVGSVEAIDLSNKRITVAHGFDQHRHALPYDHLILALGCGTNFFQPSGHRRLCTYFQIARRRGGAAQPADLADRRGELGMRCG